MATSREYYEYICDQLSDIDGVTYRPMMGEYIIYYRGRVIGGIYDDRFLVKITPSAKRLMPEAGEEIPYEGGSRMLMVDDPDNRDLLAELLPAMENEVPAPKKKKQ